ncbi:hypothetical protein D0Y65_023875 [Glycine soja]|uniref:Uncharacterized protein n=1 Tax=Glycine soja TaxID=3848 RepID=A0A445IZV8_GLYSO|nr:hypothetical protein D0Y65_023875 [Glycine soja]
MMANSCVSMDNNNILGLLKLRIKRGVNLAIRDARTSDPYVVVNMGDQRHIFGKAISWPVILCKDVTASPAPVVPLHSPNVAISSNTS